MTDSAYMIFLDDKVLLSKKQYSHWREIQDEYYEHFKTSFTAMTCREIIQYYEDDYGTDDITWPFTRKTLLDYFDSEDIILQSR